MVTSTLVNLVKIDIGSTGTGSLALGAAVAGYRGVEALTDGLTYSYSIQQGANYEVGQGVYTAASNLLSRVPTASSNGTFPIALQAGANVSFTLRAEDVPPAEPPSGDAVFGAWVRCVDTPGASLTIDLWHFTRAVQFPANFSTSSGYVRGTPPAAAYTVTIWRYAANSAGRTAVGTIVVATDRTMTFTTVGGSPLLCDVDTALEFVAAATPDVATNFAALLLGVYQ